MIYLDNSATTALSPSSKRKISEILDAYGNPSSRHTLGVEAKKVVDEARVNVAVSLGLRRSEAQGIVFTSCGTEANNLALLGTAYAKEKRRANRIITTDSEHPSVENVMQRLERDGFEVVRIPTRGGVFDMDIFESQMDASVLLVSVMEANNETGAIYDTKSIFSVAKRRNPDVITHSDCVQAYLKTETNPQKTGADLISISAHKIHGPKGVGALYVSPGIIKAKKITPYIIGGGQEGGLRSGTENILGIAGFSEAAREGFENFSQNKEKLLHLRNLCEQEAMAAGAAVNTPCGMRAPHIVSVRLPDIKSETMLNFLSSKGICVSSGSACSAHSAHISASLMGFGLSRDEADSTVRVSLGIYNTEDEIKELGDALRQGINMLVRFKR